MRLNSIHLHNFRQHADTRIDFDAGLTGVIGENGSGKSTILEGIAWSLYGNAAARGTRETLRFMRAPARATVRVELDFELGGHRYRVVRGLTNAELFLDGSSLPIANSITGVSDLLRKRLGMSREEFFNTYFTGQKELSVMAAMMPAQRAQFLSRVLGYERLRGAQELVREQRKVIAAEVTGLRGGMPDPDAVSRQLEEAERRLTDARARLNDAELHRLGADRALAEVLPRWAEAQQAREQWQSLLGELRLLESERAALARDRERLARELGELAEARTEANELARRLAPLPAMRSEFQQLETLCREEGRRQALADGMRLLEEELEKLRERHERLIAAPVLERETTELLERTRLELDQAESAHETRRTEWVRDRQEAETKRTELRKQWLELRQQRDQLVRLGPDGPCPTCTRPLGSNYQVVIDDLEARIETVQVDGSYFRQREEQLTPVPEDVQALDERRRELAAERATIERRLARIQSGVLELQQVRRELGDKEARLNGMRTDLAGLPTGYDLARHDSLRRDVERLQPLEARAARLSALLEREPQLAAERGRVQNATAALEARIADAGRRRDTMAFSEDGFATLRADHERASADARAAELALVAARGDAENAQAARESAESTQRDLANARERLATLIRSKRLHDELDRAYSDMRTDLNQALRPEISELASAFLHELTDGRYTELELDDQYNIVVLQDGTPKPVISGGEEDLAHLVLRLAISQMIAERAGQPFTLLVLDEVFGSLDEARRANVIDLLRQLRDRFEQVIVITHIEAVREGLDRVVHVRYDEETGASRVEQTEGGAVVAFDEVAA